MATRSGRMRATDVAGTFSRGTEAPDPATTVAVPTASVRKTLSPALKTTDPAASTASPPEDPVVEPATQLTMPQVTFLTVVLRSPAVQYNEPSASTARLVTPRTKDSEARVLSPYVSRP